jgi:phytoene dehydrogenase-like protein
MKKTAIVGAGAGGITSALLAAERGERVTLYEAHDVLGGCSSYFNRRDFCFDAGATTLSGVKAHEPLGIFFKKIGASPQLFSCDPGISFYLSDGRVLHYFRSFDKWMNELERAFPQLDHRPFWSKVYELNLKGWGLLNKLKNFPPRSVFDLLSLSPMLLELKDIFHLFVSTDLMLKKYQLNDPAYHELINGILLISAQAEAAEIPFLIGAMALAYPQDTYAPVGGMKGFMDFLETECRKRKIDIKLNHKINSLAELEADEKILNTTWWNSKEMIESKELNRSAWGAFALYLGVKSEISSPYHQVHLNHPLVKNYFVSFSIPNDLTRAPSGWRTVTISTHTFAEDWIGLDKASYKNLKAEFQKVILDDFLHRFAINETKFVTAGTPKTFERFTLRKRGYVGGLPFLYGKNPLRMKGHATKIPHIWDVGDTTFPGQGWAGVVAGALELDRKLKA